MDKEPSEIEVKLKSLENQVNELKSDIDYLMAHENARQKHMIQNILRKDQAELDAESSAKEV